MHKTTRVRPHPGSFNNGFDPPLIGNSHIQARLARSDEYLFLTLDFMILLRNKD
jgi:hypothetical protein